jgi:hypothetical protein
MSNGRRDEGKTQRAPQPRKSTQAAGAGGRSDMPQSVSGEKPTQQITPASQPGPLREGGSPRDAQGGMEKMTETVPAPMIPAAYKPDEIILYGVKINQNDKAEAVIPFIANKLVLQVKDGADVVLKPNQVAMAVVYGYAFEGYCYRLDRPKLMIFEYGGNEAEASGCGFYGPEYRMWRISKKRSLIELSTNVDMAEVLVLEANLPGNRAPNTYGNSVALAHRSGRIRSGGNIA